MNFLLLCLSLKIHPISHPNLSSFPSPFRYRHPSALLSCCYSRPCLRHRPEQVSEQNSHAVARWPKLTGSSGRCADEATHPNFAFSTFTPSFRPQLGSPSALQPDFSLEIHFSHEHTLVPKEELVSSPGSLGGGRRHHPNIAHLSTCRPAGLARVQMPLRGSFCNSGQTLQLRSYAIALSPKTLDSCLWFRFESETLHFRREL